MKTLEIFWHTSDFASPAYIVAGTVILLVAAFICAELTKKNSHNAK